MSDGQSEIDAQAERAACRSSELRLQSTTLEMKCDTRSLSFRRLSGCRAKGPSLASAGPRRRANVLLTAACSSASGVQGCAA